MAEETKKPQPWLDKLRMHQKKTQTPPSWFRKTVANYDLPQWQNNPRQDFWEHAEEVIARGGRLVPRYNSVPKDRSGYEFTGPSTPLPRQDDFWREGRLGASAVGAQGRTYQEVMREVELSRYPGAIGISEMGAPMYGGKNEYEERRLRAESSLRYGQGVIEDIDLTELQEQEFQTTGPLAERMDLMTRAYEDKTSELAEQQASLTSNKIYWEIYNRVGKTYHNFREGGAIVTRHIAGRAYEWAIEDHEKYNEIWENAAPAEYQKVLSTVFDTNSTTQLYGATILADMAETVLWRVMPWSYGKEENLSLIPDLARAKTYIANHPGMPSHLLQNNVVDPYWHDMAEEWLNVAEFATDITIDLAVLGMGKAWKTLRAGTKFTPRLSKVLGAMDDVPRLAGMSDEVYEVARRDSLVTAYMDDAAETVEKAHKWADKNGIFTQTNETKAALTAEQAHEGMRWMVEAMEGNADVPEFYSMLRIVGNLLSDDVDMVDDSLRAITRYGNFEFWFTEQGQAAAWVFKNVIDTDPEMLAKMVKDIGEETSNAKKMAKMLTYSDNMSTEWTRKFFPTLDEQLKVGTKAGGELAPHLRAAAKVHKQTRKLYNPIMNIFSEMYLGRTPGYAVRNTVQNFGQTIFDLGIDSTSGWKYVDDAFDWAGVDRAVEAGKIAGTQAGDVFFVGMQREMGALTQIQRELPTGKTRFLDMKWWSNEAEKLGGRTIYGHTYPKFMQNSLNGPVSKQFQSMGIDKATAKHWQNLVIQYKGDVRGAMKQVIKEADQGFRRTLSVSGFTPELQKSIDAFKMRTPVENIIATARTKEEGIALLRKHIDDTLKAAEDAVIKEGSTAPAIQHGDEILGRTATAVADGDMDRMLHNALSDYQSVNQAANDAVGYALETFRITIQDALSTTFGSQEEGAKVLKGILEELTFTPSGLLENVGSMSGAAYMAKKFSPHKPNIAKLKTGILRRTDDKLSRLADGMKGDELAEFWVKEGLQDEFGNLGDMNWRDVKNRVWQSNNSEVKLWWQQWRDQNYDFAMEVIEQSTIKAQALGAQNLPDPKLVTTKATSAYAYSTKFDGHIPQVYVDFNLRNARKPGVSVTKANRTFATEYARQFGLDNELYAIKDGREIYLDKKLTAILNKQLGTSFPDLNSITGVSEQAIKDAIRAQSLGKLRKIIKNPDEAIKAVVDILESPLKDMPENEKVVDNLIRILKETNEPLAKDFGQTLAARRMTPDAPGHKIAGGFEASNAEEYNIMVARSKKAQDELVRVSDEVVKFLEERGSKVPAVPAVELPEEVMAAWRAVERDKATLKEVKQLYRESGETLQYAQELQDAESYSRGSGMRLSAILKEEGLTRDDVRKIFLKQEPATQIAEQVIDTQTAVRQFPTEWGGEDPASIGRMLHDSRVGVRNMGKQIETNFRLHWDDIQDVKVKDADEYRKLVKQAEEVGVGMVRQARQGAAKASKETRDFILHNYQNRRNFDTLLAYIYPYHFWHTRQYANTMKRIARKPYLAKAYVKYKENMRKIHDDMPEWYRYNIKYEGGAFGFDPEHPLFINLEALINPNYGMLKVPFEDPDKRKTAFAKFLDNLGSRGPSIHTPFALLYGLAQYAQGDHEAGAKWMGRLIPQSKPLSAATAAMGLNKGRGVELDPGLIIQNLMQGKGLETSTSALGPYELNRINAALTQMVLAGQATQEEAIDAGMEQGENPLWIRAHALAQSKRNMGDMLRFVGGPGMQGRSSDEMMIMKMDQEFYALMDLQTDMTPDEKALAFKVMRDKYPTYFNVTRLTRGSQQEREESLVYNVMSRVPPGQSSQVYEAVGLNYDDVQNFYDSKGDSLESMPDTDRMKFMAGIYEMSAILAFPDDATRNEWNEASRRWKVNDARLLEFHGEETVAKEDRYWELMKEDPQKAFRFSDQNPDFAAYMSDRTQKQLFDPLMRKYYPSYGGTKSMVNAEMYQRLDDEFPGITEEQDAYFEDKTLGKKVKASDRLKEYWSRKRVLEHRYSALLVSFARWLPQGVDVPKREVLSENLSKGQEALRDLEIDSEQPFYYEWEWEDWAMLMSPGLERLVQDWAYRGAELGESAEDSLEYALEPFGIKTSEALHLIRDASERAGAEYYGEDNPPWWLEEE